MRSLREIDVRRFLKPLGILFGVFALVLIVLALLHAALFGPSYKAGGKVEFVVAPDATLESVGLALEEQGIVRHGFVFQIAYVLSQNRADVKAGGYLVSPSMDAWALAKTLGSAPYLAWVQVPPAVRYEQLGEYLAEALSWTLEERQAWLRAVEEATTTPREGRYYADTYLIPSDQSPEQIRARFVARFFEATLTLQDQARLSGRDWDDVVTLASLVERESARNDKRLVAGILANRLERGMPLQVDATLQYVVGTSTNGWWPVPMSEDKFVESPFNTYQHKGLPPYPIATPSLSSLEAVLDPEETSCLYYLHDARGRIHCSATYSGHRANINRYLR